MTEKQNIFKTKLFLGLLTSLIITSTALAVAYRCTPCSQNYYCQAGVSHECPPETPVTIGTGAKSASECITCAQRDGESYPFYDEISGDCMACWQIPESDTPYWNGSYCTTCPDNEVWDSENLTCKTGTLQTECVFQIPNGNTTICLVESAPSSYTELSVDVKKDINETYSLSDSYYGYVARTDENDSFLAKYGITIKEGLQEKDYWAGAMKYCQDKGLRLPTMDELHAIMNVVYGTNNSCSTSCSSIKNAQYVGNQTGYCDYSSGLTIANQSLYNFLGSNSTSTNITGEILLFSNAEYSGNGAYGRNFKKTESYASEPMRFLSTMRALCVK